MSSNLESSEQVLFQRILTLEILVSSIFDELVETKLIEADKVNNRIHENIVKLNNEIQNIQNISNTIEKMSMFMNSQIGEA